MSYTAYTSLLHSNQHTDIFACYIRNIDYTVPCFKEVNIQSFNTVKLASFLQTNMEASLCVCKQGILFRRQRQRSRRGKTRTRRYSVCLLCVSLLLGSIRKFSFTLFVQVSGYMGVKGQAVTVVTTG